MDEYGSGIATVTPVAFAAATVATVVVDPVHQPPPTAVRPQCAEHLQGMLGVASSPLHQRPKMMRRIAVKLLQQSMLVSAEDDLGECVLRKYITNYIGAYKVSIMWKKASYKRMRC